MFTQPPFPGTSALKRESEAQRNKFQGVSTDNLNLSNSPQYTRKPVRFSVPCRLNYSTGVNDPREAQYANISIPDIHFPPEGAMQIELESVTHVPGLEGWVNTATNHDPNQTIPSSGFIVTTDGLASSSFTAGGVGQRVTSFYSGGGIYYSPVTSPQEVETALGQPATGMHLYAGRRIDDSSITPELAHSNLNFQFAFWVYDVDNPAINNRWLPMMTADGGRDALLLTFLIKPSPFWQQNY